MSEPEKKAEQKQDVYRVKGVPVKVYLSETGDFRWIPTLPACGASEQAKEFLEVLLKMPADRLAVWATRLDTEQAMEVCPVIHEDPELRNVFDQLCDAHNKPKSKKTEDTQGVKKQHE